jgi:hypothetical protein
MNHSSSSNSGGDDLIGALDAEVRRMLPGGGRGRGKHLLSDSAAPETSNSTTTADPTIDTPGADRRRMLPGGGRGHGKRLLSQSAAQHMGLTASAPAAAAVQPSFFRTAHSRASKPNSRSRVQPRSLRLPVKPWSQCSWWEKIMGLIEALPRINDNKRWCW